MSWEKLFKRYIWDDERTPYFVPAARMTKKQADYEMFAYTVFLGVLLSIVSLAALAHGGRSDMIVLYGFSAIVSTVILGLTKHAYAACYCAAVPVVFLPVDLRLPRRPGGDRSFRADRLCPDLATPSGS